MFNILTRTLPHFVLIWYLSSIIKVNPQQLSIILTAFLAMFLAFSWNTKNKPKNWYWKLDFTYMTAWALLEISLGAMHHDITVFLISIFVNQFVFFTNSIMGNQDIPVWKYVLWNNLCFAKTIIMMTMIKTY
jgi:hypothetical protein